MNKLKLLLAGALFAGALVGPVSGSAAESKPKPKQR